ncbi:MAG: glycosyltransferase family 9 protein [Chitinophagales bacterium]|nr:glycosyltransferase family 9 protein [Bacteroidota bacterium]MCB9044286.1 glycosyltransferase family 9 protein [Chitinophagales bacterium]
MAKILIIQTAFIGDVILATSLVQFWQQHYPQDSIDFLLRKGNESLLAEHPHLRKIWIWDKKKQKYFQLRQLLQQIRHEKYDIVFNAQRFGATGFLTAFSGAKTKVGFRKNPFSIFFTHKLPHQYNAQTHEIDRLLSLAYAVSPFRTRNKPQIFPQQKDIATLPPLPEKYISIAPASVWFTKQYPPQAWTNFLKILPAEMPVLLLGGKEDYELCHFIAENSQRTNTINLSGKINLRQSAVVMQRAQMNYVNDSAPLHLASAMNAPVRAIFCSTIPDFGFTPLSDDGKVIQSTENLPCRPCGLHGYKACPKKHFRCADISPTQLLLPKK